MTKQRKTFSSADKAKVALAAIKGQKTINEIAQLYNVHPTQVNQWKKELLDKAEQVFDTKRGPKESTSVLNPDPLYAKIGELNMQVDFLKKKLQIEL
jgi:transposase